MPDSRALLTEMLNELDRLARRADDGFDYGERDYYAHRDNVLSWLEDHPECHRDARAYGLPVG